MGKQSNRVFVSFHQPLLAQGIARARRVASRGGVRGGHDEFYVLPGRGYLTGNLAVSIALAHNMDLESLLPKPRAMRRRRMDCGWASSRGRTHARVL